MSGTAVMPFGRLLAMLGPGYIVAVGYMDPGNWATDIAAGGRHGFALLSVVLMASLIGAFLQALVVRLTLATGRDLARLIRDEFPKPMALAVWAVAEIAMVATDLAELLGSAIALNLLTGLAIPIGVLVSALLGLAIVALPGAQGRVPEIVIGALVAIVGLGFVWELALARPDLASMLQGFVPSADIVRDPEMLYLSLGILGATVMPHNLFLHSGLARSRLIATGSADRRIAHRLLVDSTAALALAFLVNAAILALASVAFSGMAGESAPGIEDAYRLLGPDRGFGIASLVFAIALLAAGQSSTTTGTMAGQIVAEGFLGVRLPSWQRSLVTRGAALVPAAAGPLLLGNRAVDTLLVQSQIVLGLALPFVLVPMLLLLHKEHLMGRMALPPSALRLAGLLVALLTGLNGWLAATLA